ncbi:MAG: endonuclease domain-containing protein [Candidatus Binataceae bacterium]
MVISVRHIPTSMHTPPPRKLPPIVHGQHVTTAKLAFAKRLRRSMTPAERTLWRDLRRNQLSGIHFRRQQVVESFIIDFYCDAARLAVELDGSPHDSHGEYDERRDSQLHRRGIKVLHVTNAAVRAQPDMVLGWIAEEAMKRMRGGRAT